MQIDANEPEPTLTLPEMYLSNGMVLLPYRPADMIKRCDPAPSAPPAISIANRFPFVAIAAGAATSLLALLN